MTQRRNIGYVIQQIGLFPNMTIEENIVVVPKLLGWDKQKCHDRARELMSMIKLSLSSICTAIRVNCRAASNSGSA